MKIYTLQDIQDLSPCYPAIRHLPLDWTGTLVDMLRVESCPLEDRVWVVTKLLDDKTNRLFAVWCAREALKLVDKPDIRSIAACDVAERYAHGNATDDELRIAKAAAWDAAEAITWAARAAGAAAWGAARAAAWAAGAAAWGAVRAITWAAARDATRQAQIDKLITMIGELT